MSRDEVVFNGCIMEINIQGIYNFDPSRMVIEVNFLRSPSVFQIFITW